MNTHKMEKEKKDIKKRIEELEREIQIHNSKFNQANKIAQQEVNQIIAKKGAIEELKKLIK